jgi:hypothetical protein
LGGPDYTRFDPVYAALYTQMPAKDGGGVEVSGPGYARLAITNNATNFPAAADGEKSNGTDWDFGVAGGSWGTIVGCCLLTSEGQIIRGGPLTTPITVSQGQPVIIAAGSAVFRFT